MIPSYAILSAGNFWNLQEIFEQQLGILSTLVGYTGGETLNPTYQQVSEGQTGHFEAVKVAYNQSLIDYAHILDVFFSSHNPTHLTLMSANNHLLQPSVIFYLNDKQKELAEKKKLFFQRRFEQPIITEIRPAQIFYPAESHHQHFLLKPGQTTCCLTGKC